MTNRKKTTRGAGEKKLKLKKETIKDLDAKGRSVKGGRKGETDSVAIMCSLTCLVCPMAR